MCVAAFTAWRRIVGSGLRELFGNRGEECEVGCGGVGLAEAHIVLAEFAHQAAVGLRKLQEEGAQVGDRFMEEGDGLGGIFGVLGQHGQGHGEVRGIYGTYGELMDLWTYGGHSRKSSSRRTFTGIPWPVPGHPEHGRLSQTSGGVDFESAFGIELEDFVTRISSTLPQIRAFRSHFAGEDGSYQTVPLSSSPPELASTSLRLCPVPAYPDFHTIPWPAPGHPEHGRLSQTSSSLDLFLT